MAREIKQTPTRKSTARRKSTPHRKATRPKGGRKWSARVMKESAALDLEEGVFSSRSPAKIAASLKHAADQSRRRKAGPFQSAMSMLNFYINRGGRNLSAARRKVLEQAKAELRRLYRRA